MHSQSSTMLQRHVSPGTHMLLEQRLCPTRVIPTCAGGLASEPARGLSEDDREVHSREITVVRSVLWHRRSPKLQYALRRWVANVAAIYACQWTLQKPHG